MEKKAPRQVQEVDPKTRVEVFDGISTKVNDILSFRLEILNIFSANSEEGLAKKSWSIPGSNYSITRDLKVDSIEITLGKVRTDELTGEMREEVKIKIGRPGTSLREPSFEYYRKISGQRRRNLRPNTVGTISAIEKFITVMEKDLESVPRTLKR